VRMIFVTIPEGNLTSTGNGTSDYAGKRGKEVLLSSPLPPLNVPPPPTKEGEKKRRGGKKKKFAFWFQFQHSITFARRLASGKEGEREAPVTALFCQRGTAAHP